MTRVVTFSDEPASLKIELSDMHKYRMVADPNHEN